MHCAVNARVMNDEVRTPRSRSAWTGSCASTSSHVHGGWAQAPVTRGVSDSQGSQQLLSHGPGAMQALQPPPPPPSSSAPSSAVVPSPLKSSGNLVDSPRVLSGSKRVREQASTGSSHTFDSPRSLLRPPPAHSLHHSGSHHEPDDITPSTLPPDYDYCTQVVEDSTGPAGVAAVLWGRLICLNNQYENVQLEHEQSELLLGRHPDCDVRTRYASDNRTISARHCKLVRVGEPGHHHAQLTDLR